MLDDDPHFLKDFNLSLGQFENYILHCFAGISDARKAISQTALSPDIVVVDLNLSAGQSGLDFVGWASEALQDCALIVATSASDASVQAFEAGRLGAHHWVDKAELISPAAYQAALQTGMSNFLRDKYADLRSLQTSLSSVPEMIDQIIHELENLVLPLRNNITAIDMLLTDLEDGTSFELKNIISQTRKDLEDSLQLIADLDVYAKAGSITVAAQPTDVIVELKVYIERLGRRIPKITQKMPDNLIVSLDPKILPLMLNPIMSNAREHVGDRLELNVTVEFENGTDGGFAVFHIEDNGPGVPIELREEIFLPGRRAGNTRKQSGKGLGLAACKSYVDLCSRNGRFATIECGDRLDRQRGARFSLRLPMDPAQ